MNQQIYFFSSNIRPLYEQDILDLLALPKGALYQLRYYRRYVSSELQSDPQRFTDRLALVHFSIQDPSQYHEPAFIPVRYATLLRVEELGDILVFHVRLGDYCSLQRPTDFRKTSDVGAIVQSYAASLHASNVPTPYGLSATVGPTLAASAPLDRASSNDHRFEGVVEFLGGTRSFAEARFYRLLSVSLSSDAAAPEQSLAFGSSEGFEIEGGHTFALRFVHFQKTDSDKPARFLVSADEKIVSVIGQPGFEIASRYDVFEIHIHAIEPPTMDAKETVLSIVPADGTRGPSLKLRLRITKPAKKAFFGIAGSTTVAILLGAATLLPADAIGWKVLSVVSAAALAGFLKLKLG